jgi:hypothetical protein
MKNKTSAKIIYALFAVAIAATGLNLAVNVHKASAEWIETAPGDPYSMYWTQGFVSCGFSDCPASLSLGDLSSDGTQQFSVSGNTVVDECDDGSPYGTLSWIAETNSVDISANASDSNGNSVGTSVNSYTYSSGGAGSNPCGDNGATFGTEYQGGGSVSVDTSGCQAPNTTYYVNVTTSDVAGASYSFTIDCSNNNPPSDNNNPPTTDNSTTATINVKADRNTSWAVSGGGTSFTGINETSDSYVAPASDSGTSYGLTDLNLNTPYGFTVDNSGTVLRNSSSILARVIKSVEASDCSGWTCDLTTNGTINYNLSSTYCNITVQTTVDGNTVPLTGLNYSVAPDDFYDSFTYTPQTFPLIADPLGNTQFSLNGFSPPSTITYDGKTADLVGVSPVNAPVCSGTDNTPYPNLTFTAAYTTRASINIH